MMFIAQNNSYFYLNTNNVIIYLKQNALNLVKAPE